MRKLWMWGAAVAAIATVAPASAQMLPLGVEVRGGAAFPMGDFGDVFAAETGVSYGVTASLQATSLLGVYAGFERAEFGVDDTALGEADLTDQGFAFGARLSLPFGGLTGLGPWVRAGAVYNQISRETDSTVGDFESDRKFGFEVGGGLSIPLGMVVSVTPGVRYRTYSPGLTGNLSDTNVSYLVADLGLSFGF